MEVIPLNAVPITGVSTTMNNINHHRGNSSSNLSDSSRCSREIGKSDGRHDSARGRNQKLHEEIKISKIEVHIPGLATTLRCINQRGSNKNCNSYRRKQSWLRHCQRLRKIFGWTSINQ
jgi:hypothetical protein